MKELKHDFGRHIFSRIKPPLVISPNILFNGSLNLDQDIFLMYINIDTAILFSDKV